MPSAARFVPSMKAYSPAVIGRLGGVTYRLSQVFGVGVVFLTGAKAFACWTDWRVLRISADDVKARFVLAPTRFDQIAMAKFWCNRVDKRTVGVREKVLRVEQYCSVVALFLVRCRIVGVRKNL